MAEKFGSVRFEPGRTKRVRTERSGSAKDFGKLSRAVHLGLAAREHCNMGVPPVMQAPNHGRDTHVTLKPFQRSPKIEHEDEHDFFTPPGDRARPTAGGFSLQCEPHYGAWPAFHES